MAQTSQAVLEWKTPEHRHRPRSKDWYWIFGIVVVTAITLALIAGNVLFALIVILASFVIFAYATKEQGEHHIALVEKGVRIDHTLYPFENIKAFWIYESEEEEDPLLLLALSSGILPVIFIPINVDVVDLDDLHGLLLEVVPEHELDVPFSHKIVRYLNL